MVYFRALMYCDCAEVLTGGLIFLLTNAGRSCSVTREACGCVSWK